MKIAFATSDGVHVDEQFRRASQLALYEVGPAGPRLDRIFTFAGDVAARTDERLRAIEGAAIVYGVAFGPSSAARIAEQGIQPATAPAGTPIARLLSRFTPVGRGVPGAAGA
jgi:nitrogen fixation protein NifX